MKLTLTILSHDRLDNGLPTHMQLAERGAIIGRSPTVSWCLPDTSNHVSSRHCEISFRDGKYLLTDTSTNGTFVNANQLSAPHTLRTGDVVTIGAYQIKVEVEGQSAEDGAAATAAEAKAASNASNGAWGAWESMTPAKTASSGDDWGKPAPQAAISGAGSMSQNWVPPTAKTADNAWGAPASAAPAPSAPSGAASGGWGAPPSPAATPAASASASWGPAASETPAADPWGSAAPVSMAPSPDGSPWGTPAASAPAQAASPWSSAGPAGQAPAADDIWGKFAENNAVDWARGGFGQPAAAAPVAKDVLGLNKEANFTESLGSNATPDWAKTPNIPEPQPAPAPSPAPVAAPPPAPHPVAAATSGVSLDGFLEQLGLSASDIKASEAETLAMSALLLRRLIAGMVVMLEARARAKSQMGAQGTALSFEGNNPMKFARTPEQALLQLLNPPERGFMTSERAIEDAFLDLQSHQMATLRAMQGALKATLDRFSPSSIRERAESGGLMAKIFQDSRDAALWKAYEREFSGVVQGSDEAFMDVFSKEFRRAYDELTAKKSF